LFGLLAVEIAIKMSQQAKTAGSTDYSALIGAIFLAIGFSLLPVILRNADSKINRLSNTERPVNLLTYRSFILCWLFQDFYCAVLCNTITYRVFYLVGKKLFDQ
jgi:hypothetical protein